MKLPTYHEDYSLFQNENHINDNLISDYLVLYCFYWQKYVSHPFFGPMEHLNTSSPSYLRPAGAFRLPETVVRCVRLKAWPELLHACVGSVTLRYYYPHSRCPTPIFHLTQMKALARLVVSVKLRRQQMRSVFRLFDPDSERVVSLHKTHGCLHWNTHEQSLAQRDPFHNWPTYISLSLSVYVALPCKQVSWESLSILLSLFLF